MGCNHLSQRGHTGAFLNKYIQLSSLGKSVLALCTHNTEQHNTTHRPANTKTD